MTRVGRRLIEDFLLPALDEGRYGDLLKWIDRDKCYFSIRWSHKNAAKWTLSDTAVFQDWDRLKGHYHPEIKGYYMQAKQRFRAALYKLNTVRKIPCEDKHVKKYQLVLNPDKKHHEIMPRKSHQKLHREENQKSIPTPVICRNTSFIAAKPQSIYTEEPFSSPSSPASSIKSEVSDKIEEEELCVEEYQRAILNQRMQNTAYQHTLKTIKTEDVDVDDCPATVLRESPQMNNVRKAPHVPIQLVPVYKKLNCRQTVENSQMNKVNFQQTVENSQRITCRAPCVLLVPTYNDTDMDIMNSEEKDVISSLYNGNGHNSDGALNLCVKCDESETLCR